MDWTLPTTYILYYSYYGLTQFTLRTLNTRITNVHSHVTRSHEINSNLVFSSISFSLSLRSASLSVQPLSVQPLSFSLSLVYCSLPPTRLVTRRFGSLVDVSMQRVSSDTSAPSGRSPLFRLASQWSPPRGGLRDGSTGMGGTAGQPPFLRPSPSGPRIWDPGIRRAVATQALRTGITGIKDRRRLTASLQPL